MALYKFGKRWISILSYNNNKMPKIYAILSSFLYPHNKTGIHSMYPKAVYIY